MATFAPYGRLHLASVIVSFIIIVITTLLGRAFRSTKVEVNLRRAIAIWAVCYFVAYNVWWNWKGIDITNGLPLQICDLNGMIGPLALWTGNRWVRATLYFWAFALTLQAFIQPTLTAGPTSPIFWTFWLAHTIVMICAVYDVAVLGFRPDWRDLGYAAAVSALYLVIILPLDLRLDANYGFVGNPSPARGIPPFVAALGPWPLRVLIVVGLAALAFVVLLVPWRLRESRKEPQ